MLHPPAGRSRSLGQQLGKHGYRRLIAWQVAPEDNWCLENEANVCREDHVLAQAWSRVLRCTSVNNSAQVCHSVKSMKLINSKLVARLFQDHVQYLFHSSNYRGSIGSAFTEFRDFTQTKTWTVNTQMPFRVHLWLTSDKKSTTADCTTVLSLNTFLCWPKQCSCVLVSFAVFINTANSRCTREHRICRKIHLPGKCNI